LFTDEIGTVLPHATGCVEILTVCELVALVDGVNGVVAVLF
jgi:hypothetical protein